MGKNEKNKTTWVIINIARLLFIGLIIFELLNYFKILQLNTQFTWLGLVITSVFSFIVLEIIAYKYKKKKGHLLHWLIWLIIVAGLSLDAFGDFFHFYGRITWWDQAVHYFVSGAVAFTLFIVISAFWIDKFKFSLLLKTGRLKLSLLLASAIAISLGDLYEIEEYLEDVFFHTHRSGPGMDTPNDLVWNLLGVITAAVIIYGYYLITKRRKIFDK